MRKSNLRLRADPDRCRHDIAYDLPLTMPENVAVKATGTIVDAVTEYDQEENDEQDN